MEDSSLLTRIVLGDVAAMEVIFLRYSGPVFSIAHRVLGHIGAAEEVMQETFLEVWLDPNAFMSSRGSLGASLFATGRNRAIDKLRQRKPTGSVHDSVLLSPLNLAAEPERNILIVKARRILRDLPHEQRQILALSYFEGLSHYEIAEHIGESANVVKTRIRLALMRLREELSG